MPKNYLSTNSKLRKDNIYKFSLPKGKTCIGAGDCLNWCFAGKGFYRIHEKTISVAHERNLELTKNLDFVQVITSELKRRKSIKIIRIHDSGDFYSQVYVNKWFTIAKNFPEKRFYAYTKSLNLDFSGAPENFKIIQSFGSKYDEKIDMNKPHAIVFKTLKTLNIFKYENCTNSDLLALETSNNKIGLILH